MFFANLFFATPSAYLRLSVCYCTGIATENAGRKIIGVIFGKVPSDSYRDRPIKT